MKSEIFNSHNSSENGDGGNKGNDNNNKGPNKIPTKTIKSLMPNRSTYSKDSDINSQKGVMKSEVFNSHNSDDTKKENDDNNENKNNKKNNKKHNNDDKKSIKSSLPKKNDYGDDGLSQQGEMRSEIYTSHIKKDNDGENENDNKINNSKIKEIKKISKNKTKHINNDVNSINSSLPKQGNYGIDDEELSDKPEVKSEINDINLISEIDNQSNINNETKKGKNINKPKVVEVNNKDSLISCEVDITTIQNPLFNSIRGKSEIKDDEKPENQESNISNLNINKTLNTIQECLNEDDNSTSKYSIQDKNKGKEGTKLENNKSDIKSENSEQYTEKKDYDKDSDISSIFKKSNNFDLHSNFSRIDDKKSEINNNILPNPPKKLKIIKIEKSKKIEKNNVKNERKKNDNIIININNKSKKNKKKKEEDYENLKISPNLITNSKDGQTSKPLNKSIKIEEEKNEINYKFGKVGEVFYKKFGYMNNIVINDKILDNNLELLSLDEFSEKYRSFPNLYLESLKRHHLIHFTFLACNDNNNLFLKLSFFCISINFYFGLNTMLIIDSNMSEAYYDKEKAKAGYILMNLVVPFIICGLISFAIKLIIMPSYSIDRIIKKIQNNKNLRKIVLKGEIRMPNIIEIQSKNKAKEDINNKNNSELDKNKENEKEKLDKNTLPTFESERKKLEDEFTNYYKFYMKAVMIYFIASFILLALNWYFMTSYCAIFRNSGLKLIVNSVISVLASFIHPFILGLIPAVIGILAIKLKKELFYKIYKKINILL